LVGRGALQAEGYGSRCGSSGGLAGLDFLRRAENILLIGDPGTGKTGLALRLLREACDT
jgi:predicted NACHT family NTPase